MNFSPGFAQLLHGLQIRTPFAIPLHLTPTAMMDPLRGIAEKKGVGFWRRLAIHQPRSDVFLGSYKVRVECPCILHTHQLDSILPSIRRIITFQSLMPPTANMDDKKGPMTNVETSPVETKAGLRSEDQELAHAVRNYVPDSAEEKKLVRKIDLRLMPTLWIMYILNYVDRTNIVSLSTFRPLYLTNID
jgi:hypothetical protein